MSIPIYDPHARYRQRAAKRMSNFLAGMFLIAMIFGAGFWIGNINAQQDTYILEEEKRVLTEEQTRLQDEITQMRAEAQTASVRLEQLRTNYEALISDSAMQGLVELLKKQIDKGVDKGRLESVISLARPPQNCSKPQKKRFIVKTPAFKGPTSKASIAGGKITIWAEGVSAQNTSGAKEAWFDPARPISLSIKVRDKDLVIKEGVLPLYYSAVLGDKEYRLSVESGNKSFAKISFDYCDYP